MKKILIALLAVLLCLSFVACDDSADTTTPGDTTDVVTPGTDDTDGTEPDDETTEPNETTQPETTKPAETTEPEVVDSDTLAVGENDGTGFSPVKQ